MKKNPLAVPVGFQSRGPGVVHRCPAPKSERNRSWEPWSPSLLVECCKAGLYHDLNHLNHLNHLKSL